MEFDEYFKENPFDQYTKVQTGQQMGKVAMTSLMSEKSIALKEAIENDQPNYLEQVHKSNASMTQNLKIEPYPENYVFAMV